jgi:hypothetical protein
MKPIQPVDRQPHSYTDPSWQLIMGLQYGYSCTAPLPTPGSAQMTHIARREFLSSLLLASVHSIVPASMQGTSAGSLPPRFSTNAISSPCVTEFLKGLRLEQPLE